MQVEPVWSLTAPLIQDSSPLASVGKHLITVYGIKSAAEAESVAWRLIDAGCTREVAITKTWKVTKRSRWMRETSKIAKG